MEAYQRLEHEWAAFNGLDPAGMVVCNSGTAALHLALEALHLPAGSEVLCGDFNMVAVPRAIVMAGLTTVFVDCTDNLLMDPDLVAQAMFDARSVSDPRYSSGKVQTVRAIIDTAVYGRCGDDDRRLKIGDMPIGTFVIEDLAEAHGVRPAQGTDVACWSFYRNKIVAGEEGGAVWFRNPDHAALARSLRTLGFTAAHDYTHVPRGHNYRLANALAELILRSLSKYGVPIKAPDGQVFPRGTPDQRRQIEVWYDAWCPAEWRMPARDAVWVYDVRLPGLTYHGLDRVVGALQLAGIPARHGFKPMIRLEEFKLCRRVAPVDTADETVGTTWSSRTGYGPQESVADRMAREVLYLPVQPGRTTEADCRRAFEIIQRALPLP